MHTISLTERFIKAHTVFIIINAPPYFKYQFRKFFIKRVLNRPRMNSLWRFSQLLLSFFHQAAITTLYSKYLVKSREVLYSRKPATRPLLFSLKS